MTTNCKQDRPVLASKPSNVSTTSSVASATSIAGSARSGGSRLLFGEIDTSSQRSTDSYASVCSLVLCDSSTFLKFWLNDDCRERFVRHVPSTDLQNLRLVCHDFSVRAAPALFNDLKINFKTSTFTRPARLAALDRVGYHVKKLRFNLAHSAQTFLPPLVDPETGDELSFTYTPQVVPNPKLAKYGDCGTTEILTRQYPPLFHAATNVPAFVRAFSALVNLKDLEISCPGYDSAALKHRRSVVDFALVSVRIAVEKSHLNALESLTLSPIHPGALQYLSPAIGYGADPRSMRCWARVKKLQIEMNATSASLSAGRQGQSHAHGQGQRLQQQQQSDQFRLLQTYLRNFQRNLTRFSFHWIGTKSPMPIQTQPKLSLRPEMTHPALKAQPSLPSQNSSSTPTAKPHSFPNLTHLELENVTATASDIHNFVALHRGTLRELNLEDIELVSGTWDEALAPLTPPPPRTPKTQRLSAESRAALRSIRSSSAITIGGMDEIPIMLSPTATSATATPERKATSPPRARTQPTKAQHSEPPLPLSPPLASPLFLLKPTIFKPAANSRPSHPKPQQLSANASQGIGSLRLSQRILSTVHSTMHSSNAASTATAATAGGGAWKKDDTGLRRVLRGGMLGLRGDLF
ncbi:hypothetical protein K431DRAFT_304809 [Polychaeton citri CBS 116435]|uniref:Uncharacterized protein n=1 Tax=Polychaeton citri CBS 116435 TaxID=1314669 RepID=A0A9P4Q7F3_9PEZI|nr:hypothetical protein K431DRAFT_304809 [Polychaeton citri CBS 116435]